jgi:hypothetical protein
MSKYQNLGSYLSNQPFNEVPMSFAEIEKVIDAKLPPKAQLHRAWWSNSPSNNVMTKVWLDAGFRSEQVDMAGRKLVFRRIKPAHREPPKNPPQHGMAEPQSAFKHQGGVAPKRSPLWGALKGLLWIEPGYDLAQSPFTKEELDDMDKRMEEKAALIDAGMRKPK